MKKNTLWYGGKLYILYIFFLELEVKNKPFHGEYLYMLFFFLFLYFLTRCVIGASLFCHACVFNNTPSQAPFCDVINTLKYM